MPTFLSRPVFDFPLNWATQPKAQFSYDLREHVLGLAASRFEQLRSYTVQGFEFGIDVSTESDLVAFETFTDQLRGRLNGFWCPSPFIALQIIPGIVSNVQFEIRDQNLRDSLADHPSQYVVFSKTGQTSQYGKISTVERTADGRELVTLESALASAVDDSWDVRKLLYVRLADDAEKASFWADNVQRRTIRVVELPTEYASIETGQLPVYLYRFRMVGAAGLIYWNFTGLNENISSTLNGTIGSTSFTSFPIEHDAVKRSMRPAEDEQLITSWFDPANPISQFVPFTAARPLYVTIYETTYSAPNAVTVLFDGRVKSAKPTHGKMLKAKCSSLLDRAFPRFLFQTPCNYLIFDSNCGVSKAAFSITVQITAITGRKVTVTVTASATPITGESASADFNYWALGGFDVVDGANLITRGIIQSGAVYTITGGGHRIDLRLDQPIPASLVGELCTIWPGCDGAFATCTGKFYNRRRFGGHWPAPQNLSVQAVQRNASPNKK